MVKNIPYLSENQVLNKRSYPSLIGNIPLNGAFGHWEDLLAFRRKGHYMGVVSGWRLKYARDVEAEVRTLSLSESLVYNELVELASFGISVYPSCEWIVKKICKGGYPISLSTVDRALPVLCSKGLLERRDRGRVGPRNKMVAPRLNLVPDVILKSHTLRKKLRVLLPCLMYFSMFMVVSVSAYNSYLSRRRDTGARESLLHKDVKEAGMVKQTGVKNAKPLNSSQKKEKKEEYTVFCGKKVRVKYVHLGREDKKWERYVEFNEGWLNEAQQVVELKIYAQKMLKIRVKNSQEYNTKHDEDIQKLKDETPEQKDKACADLDELVKNNPLANMFAVYAKNGINNSRAPFKD